MVLEITETQENNLRILAEGLLNLPEDYSQFEMNTFLDYDKESIDDGLLPIFATNDSLSCGTVACACGHGPSLGIPALPSEDWEDYSYRVFGLNELSYQFEWCFSGVWENHDNTPHGAAYRILYMLDQGVPDWFGNFYSGDEEYYLELINTMKLEYNIKS